MSVVAVVNVARVWAGEIDPSLKLQPRRGIHLVFDVRLLANPAAALTILIPGELNRFVFAMLVQAKSNLPWVDRRELLQDRFPMYPDRLQRGSRFC